jgi:hypothetical protein
LNVGMAIVIRGPPAASNAVSEGDIAHSCLEYHVRT